MQYDPNTYRPLLDGIALMDFLATLPIAIRITPRVSEQETKFIWQVMEKSGQSDDLQGAVHHALLSCQQQLLLDAEGHQRTELLKHLYTEPTYKCLAAGCNTRVGSDAGYCEEHANLLYKPLGE